jgi:hypothetical protein
LYGFETWSLTLSKEHRLKVFENRALRRIFGHKSEKVIGGWRRLHNEELRNLYASPNVIRETESVGKRWVGHVKCMEVMRSAYTNLVGNSGGKRPLGISRCRWEDDITMDLREIGWEGVDWRHLAQGRDQWRALVKRNEPLGFIKCE